MIFTSKHKSLSTYRSGASVTRFLGEGAIAVTTAIVAAAPAFAVSHSWSVGNGAWSTGTNWSPIGAPGAGDAALIGTHAGAANAVSTINYSATVDSLTLTDGMTLRTASDSLHVNGTTQVAGQNIVGPSTFTSRLRIENGVGGVDYETDDLSLTDFGQVTLESDASMLVLGTATLAAGTELSGRGTGYFSAASGSAIVNNGKIEATGGGLTLFQTGAARFDLDGTTGSGILAVTSGGGTGLTVSGDQLNDAFSGDIELAPNSRLDMNLSAGWATSSSTHIDVVGTGVASPAIIDGGALTLHGNISLTGAAARLQVEADTAISSDVSATVDNGNELSFSGDTIIEGGTFNIAGPSGQVSFLGPTDWQGTVALNGRSRVNSLAVVTAATTINAGQIDLDGTSGVTQWDINAALTVNTDQIDTSTNSFDGALDIGGGVSGRLTLNLANPAQSWQMQGTMDLTGVSGLWFTRVAGSRMEVGGDINIANADIDISAGVTLQSGSSINFSVVTSDLRFSGESRIESGAGFTGQGLLHNNALGEGMVIAGGVSLGQAGLVNSGRLTIGNNGPGQVSVNRFSSDSDATLSVSVGGLTPGTELSRLVVTAGTAQLDGALAPTLFDDGGGLFAPSLDDVFTIITAPGGIVGQFDSVIQPRGLPTGLLFEVQYTANSVSLFMDTTYAADFDRDGDVDNVDYGIWRGAFALNNYGDANGDSLTDAADYVVWRDQYGLGLPVAMGSAIPEPTTISLVALALLGLRRRQR